MGFEHSKANDFGVNVPMWLKFKLNRDCMLVLIISKIDTFKIKNKVAISRTAFTPLSSTSMGVNNMRFGLAMEVINC